MLKNTLKQQMGKKTICHESKIESTRVGNTNFELNNLEVGGGIIKDRKDAN